METSGHLRKTYNVASSTEVSWLLSRRFQLALMGFLGTLLLYLQRASMSVAIVCMTMDDQEDEANGTSPYNDTSQLNDVGEGAPRFEWSRQLRGWVLSSYYIGYILTQIPGGWVAKRYGAKWTLEVGMGVLTVLTLLTPLAAGLNVYVLMVLQALKGAASGAYYPVFYHMLGVWALPVERSVMVAMFSSGAPLGTVLSFVLSGYLCHHGYAGGWPSIFYTFGTASGIWCIFWVFTVYETPEVHPRISPAEKQLFTTSLGSTSKLQLEQAGHQLTFNMALTWICSILGLQKKRSVPWRLLLTTWPLYAIFFTDMCYSFGWFVALNSLPQYLKDVFKFDIKQNGLYNSLPYLSNWAVSIVGSISADHLLKRKVLSRTAVRKLFETFGLLPSAACALGVAFLCSHVPRVGAVALLSLWVGFLGFTRSAADVNQMELAPAYAGIIMGIDQTLTSIPGIVAPPVVGLITQSGAGSEWRVVFLLTAGVFTLGWLVYVIFTTAEEADWSREESCRFGLEQPFRHFANMACVAVAPYGEALSPSKNKIVPDIPQIFIVSQVVEQDTKPP